MNDIGKLIKDARLAKGLTQEELGALVGLQKSAIAKYENGRVVNIKRSTLQGLAIALGLKASDLIMETDPQNTQGTGSASADNFSRVSSTPERLREAMTAREKKQVDLVRETGIDKGSISNYLSGRYEPKQEAIYKLAKALDVSEMWLWGYDVPQERPKEQKNNDAIADIVLRLRTDEKFLLAVEKVYRFDTDKLESLLHLLD